MNKLYYTLCNLGHAISAIYRTVDTNVDYRWIGCIANLQLIVVLVY